MLKEAVMCYKRPYESALRGCKLVVEAVRVCRGRDMELVEVVSGL